MNGFSKIFATAKVRPSSRALASIFFIFTLWGLSVQAIDVEWKEPQVMGSSDQKGRKIVRFAGQTDPNTVIELQRGTQYYLSDGSSRSFSLSAEDRRQFPISIGEDGYYVFDLHVPVKAIEVPLLMKNGKERRNSVLNFRVPLRAGKIENLSDLEKSYTSEATDDDDKYTRARGKYTKKRDRGQVITRRRNGGLRNDERVQVRRKRANIKFHGSLGPSWTALRQDSPDVLYSVEDPDGGGNRLNQTGFDHNKNALAIPVWRLGASWDMSPKWRFALSVRDTPLIYQPDAGLDSITFPKGQANWTTGQLSASYFFKQLSFGWLGADFGVQLHSQPFYRLRNEDNVFNYEDSLMIDAFVGVRLKSSEDRKWPWQAYAHVFVPFYTNSEVFSGTGVGFEVGGGADRELMPGLSGGIWGYVQQYFLYPEYTHTNNGTESLFTSSYSLTSATVEVRVTVRF